jgi:penicillin-binding protein 1A
MLKQTLEIGTGRSAAIADWHAAGKTGTSQEFRDAWFIGYTAHLAAGIWFGNDDGKPTKKMTGGNLPAVAWQQFMNYALDGVPVADLPGDYRFRDPSGFADNQPIPRTISPPMPIGGIDGLLSSPGAVADVDAPPPREKRRGFLQRLFGG